MFTSANQTGDAADSDADTGTGLTGPITLTAGEVNGTVDAGVRLSTAQLGNYVWVDSNGNGTQDAFYDDPSVLFASVHQWPFYPGTGAIDEIGTGDARGTTINVPLPAGSTGDVYLDAIDRVVGPALARFAPTWVLLSMGYDAHRDDPLTAMGLTSGDYALLVAALLDVIPEAKVIALLEGGYDLDAVRRGVHATLTAFAGSAELPERPSSGSRRRDMVDAVVQMHRGVLG